jgi:hypothetical protein
MCGDMQQGVGCSLGTNQELISLDRIEIGGKRSLDYMYGRHTLSAAVKREFVYPGQYIF